MCLVYFCCAERINGLSCTILFETLDCSLKLCATQAHVYLFQRQRLRNAFQRVMPLCKMELFHLGLQKVEVNLDHVIHVQAKRQKTPAWPTCKPVPAAYFPGMYLRLKAISGAFTMHFGLQTTSTSININQPQHPSHTSRSRA